MNRINTILFSLVLFLFLNSNTFGFNIPQGSIILLNPDIISGNFNWVYPDYEKVINLCNAEKISFDINKDADRPYVYNNIVVWKQGVDHYLREEGDFTFQLSMQKGVPIEDFNDNKILYKYNYYLYLFDIFTHNTEILDSNAINYDFISYDNNEVAYNRDNKIFFMSDFTTKEIASFNNSAYNSRPSLSNGKVAWAAKDNNSIYQIYFWNGQYITQITSTNQNNYSPDLYYNKIAWEGYKNGHYQIFYWDGNTIAQITNTDYDNYQPKLYDGKIVWYANSDNDIEIFYWNGQNIRQLTDNNVDDYYPDIYNGRIAWLQNDANGNPRNIYTCKVETSTKPSISYTAITDLTSTSVKLNGKVNPNGQETQYRFDYTTNPSGTHTYTNWEPLGNGKTEIYVSKTLNNLIPDTKYYYRLIAKNTKETTYGTVQSFRTRPSTPLLPEVTTGGLINTNPCTLSAVINPNGINTTYHFEYGTDTNYGNNTTESGVGSGITNVTVTYPLLNLQPDTLYHYRAVAQNAAGTVEGDDKTFTTPSNLNPAMNIPSGKNVYTYSPVEDPGLNTHPESAKPFAVGNVLGGTLNLKVGLNKFAHPVDIYLAISYSGLPGDIFLINSSNGLQKNTIVSWKTNQTDALNESLFGNVNTSDLPEGIYTLYLLVVPTGATNMDNSYLWVTSFNIAH